MDSFVKSALKRVKTFGEEAGTYANSAATYAKDTATYAKDTAASAHARYNKLAILKASYAQIHGVKLARSSHSIAAVNGRAYIFGGEVAEGRLADNEMHVVILPSSGVLEADYKSIPARPQESSGPVPKARKLHTTVAVGDLIFLFGGKLEGDATEEGGRVWVFDTVANTWSYLDPSHNGPYPKSRYGHATAASEEPGPRDANPVKVEFTLQFNTKESEPGEDVPEPASKDSWGTLFIYGGKSLQEELLNDVWSFDVKTRTWNSLPAPRASAGISASLAVSGNRLCLFGGTASEMQLLDVAGLWKFGERGTAFGDLASSQLVTDWTSLDVDNGPDERSRAALVDVFGFGPHALLLVGGEGAQPHVSSEKGKETEATATASKSATVHHDDVWLYQIDTNASIKDATRHDMGKVTEAASWTEAESQFVDIYGDVVEGLSGVPGFGRRSDFAFGKGTEVDGSQIIIWGGKGSSGKVLDDGWMVTVAR